MTYDSPFQHDPTPKDLTDRYGAARLNLARHRNDPRLHREVQLFEAVIGTAVERAGGLDD